MSDILALENEGVNDAIVNNDDRPGSDTVGTAERLGAEVKLMVGKVGSAGRVMLIAGRLRVGKLDGANKLVDGRPKVVGRLLRGRLSPVGKTDSVELVEMGVINEAEGRILVGNDSDEVGSRGPMVLAPMIVSPPPGNMLNSGAPDGIKVVLMPENGVAIGSPTMSSAGFVPVAGMVVIKKGFVDPIGTRSVTVVVGMIVDKTVDGNVKEVDKPKDEFITVLLTAEDVVLGNNAPVNEIGIKSVGIQSFGGTPPK
ncbi:hypothetical protein MMC25_003930 [Agyrium rufum]|nr:hypothetical protein [Agyrium rufum]